MAWWGCVYCLRLRHFGLYMGKEYKEETRIGFCVCLLEQHALSGN